jgi:uncharacterized protein (DUF924 family)
LADQFYDLCFEDVLVIISKYRLENLPSDFTIFLPSTASRDYPIQALGLIILLDQVPRYCMDGIDKRWISGYFDIISERLMRQLFLVPWEQRWDNPTRWKAMGYSPQHILLRRLLMCGAFCHSEDWADHLMSFGLVEQLRRETEELYNSTDTYRAVQVNDAKNLMAFGEVLGRYPVLREGITRMDHFIFLFSRIIRIHEPMIREFGRSPEKSVYLGLESTDSEKDYLNKIGFDADPNVIAKIREDKIAGSWTPLQGRGGR